MARQVAIGVRDYASLIEKNCFYIDKTLFIKEWWEREDAVTLITRPRRFGKTLTMNMCNCFFSNKYAGRSDLFEGFAIWKEEKFRSLQGTYPAIFMTFAGVKGRNYSEAAIGIKKQIVELFSEHSYLVGYDGFDENEKKALANLVDN